MIFYCTGSRFFEHKKDAEQHRVQLGLKPGATHKLSLANREEIVNFLNGLCEQADAGDAPEPTTPVEIVTRSINVKPVYVPDFVPQFLLRPESAKARAAQKDMPSEHAGTHGGFKIERCEHGYFWQEGGYFDTIEECQEEIDDHNAAEEQRDRETFGVPDDTPSLPPVPPT